MGTYEKRSILEEDIEDDESVCKIEGCRNGKESIKGRL